MHSNDSVDFKPMRTGLWNLKDLMDSIEHAPPTAEELKKDLELANNFASKIESFILQNKKISYSLEEMSLLSIKSCLVKKAHTIAKSNLLNKTFFSAELLFISGYNFDTKSTLSIIPRELVLHILMSSQQNASLNFKNFKFLNYDNMLDRTLRKSFKLQCQSEK